MAQGCPVDRKEVRSRGALETHVVVLGDTTIMHAFIHLCIDILETTRLQYILVMWIFTSHPTCGRERDRKGEGRQG